MVTIGPVWSSGKPASCSGAPPKSRASHRPLWTMPGPMAQRLQITELLEPMSTDEMIECLGSCRARWEIAAMIEALSLPSVAKHAGRDQAP